MSDSDSFINEVTEEVRRDRLFGYMRRYGWIAALAILILVGGAAWNEWRKAEARAAAQSLGDAMLGALESDDAPARISALRATPQRNASSKAVLDLLIAAETVTEKPEEAARLLLEMADRADTDPVYGAIATIKAVSLPGSGLDLETRRARMEGFLAARGLIRLLAEEQLALIDLEAGDRSASLERLLSILADAEATEGLRRRVTQVIVALGAELPDLPAADTPPVPVAE